MEGEQNGGMDSWRTDRRQCTDTFCQGLVKHEERLGGGDVATFAGWDQSFFVIPLLLDIHVYEGIYRPFCLPYSVP